MAENKSIALVAANQNAAKPFLRVQAMRKLLRQLRALSDDKLEMVTRDLHRILIEAELRQYQFLSENKAREIAQKLRSLTTKERRKAISELQGVFRRAALRIRAQDEQRRERGKS